MMVYVIMIAIFLVGCDSKYTVDYAQKKYNEVVTEGKSYADSIKQAEKAHKDSTIYFLDYASFGYCNYKNRIDMELSIPKPPSNLCTKIIVK